MAVLHQIKPGYLELSFEWKLIANTSYKCVLFFFCYCVCGLSWSVCGVLLDAHSKLMMLTLWPHLVVPAAGHGHVQGWLAADQTGVLPRTRSSCGWRMRRQGVCVQTQTGWKPFTCLFLLFALGGPCAGLHLLTRANKKGKGERPTEDHPPDECKPFRDGEKNKTKQRKQAIKIRAGTCFASIVSPVVI